MELKVWANLYVCVDVSRDVNPFNGIESQWLAEELLVIYFESIQWN